jgi:hypothetical protein
LNGFSWPHFRYLRQHENPGGQWHPPEPAPGSGRRICLERIGHDGQRDFFDVVGTGFAAGRSFPLQRSLIARRLRSSSTTTLDGPLAAIRRDR